MNKKTVMVGLVLSLAVFMAGTSFLLGCRSNMSALNSDMPNIVNESIKGEYVLERIKSNTSDVRAVAIREAIQKDAVAQSIFKGKVESKDALPIDITVNCTTNKANGSIAYFNDFLSLCTLTLWPCVDTEEYEYTVTVSSVIGSHNIDFKVLNRSWFGLSPLAAIPVPGWSDQRGDEAVLKQFHASQISQAVKVACAELPNDYVEFKRNQSKYLELISQLRSERAYSAFLAAGTVEAQVKALSKVTNAITIEKHQDDFVNAFKENPSEGTIRAAILPKLNKGSFDKLPYDPMLSSYWQKLSNPRLLAMVYRDGYAKLSETDRRNLVAKIADDSVLAEMVTVSSKDDGLYVKDAKARIVLYQVMKPEMVKRLADTMLATHKLSDWANKNISAFESVADMSCAIADKSVATEIAILLACKVDSYWRECKNSWSFSWGDADRKQWSNLKKKIAPVLTDDILVSKIKADRKLWSALVELISDKAKVSALAYEFIVEAAKSGKEKDIKEAWEGYGNNISDDVLLMKLSVSVRPLRRTAFLKIKDEAVKTKTLAAIKSSLESDLKKCTEKQGELANFIAEINHGEELVEWLKGKDGQTEIQRKRTFNQHKGRIIILKGDVREVGKAMFSEQLFASLHVGNISAYERINIQFNIPDKLTSIVSSWQRGETYVMRGKIASSGDLIDDAVVENAEIIKSEDYDAVIGLKEEVDSIKWQIKEIDEKKIPPEFATPSKFGGAVKKAAGWIKSGVDDIKASEDDLEQAAEMLKGLFF